MIMQTFFIELAKYGCEDWFVLIVCFCDSGFDGDFCVCLLEGGSRSESSHVGTGAKLGMSLGSVAMGRTATYPLIKLRWGCDMVVVEIICIVDGSGIEAGWVWI